MPINNFFIEVSKALLKRKFKIVLLVHGKADYVNRQLKDHNDITIVSWPSIAPSSLRDVIFLTRLIFREKPNWIIANMRFQNIILFTSYILFVPNVISWIHTPFNDKRQSLKRFDWLNKRAKSFLLKTSKKIIPVSKSLGEIVQKRYGLNKEKFSPINNVLKDISKDIIRIEPEDNCTIICVGRLVYQKGHRILFHAFKNLLDKGYQVKLSLVGEGPLRNSLEELSEQLEISEYCTFHGNLSHAEVISMTDNSFCTVIPSAYEGLPYVLLESMALEKPIIASRIDSVKEVINDGHDGLLFHPGDSGDLFEKLSMLIDDKMLCEKIKQNARRNFINNYSLDDQMPSIINKILD